MSAVNNQNKVRKTGYAYYQEKQQSLVKTIIKLQCLVLLLLLTTVALVTSFNSSMVLSVLIGGLCAIVPNLYFAYFSFRYIGAKNARKVLNSIYFAEMLKFVLVVCLLSISYSIPWLRPQGVLLGFLVLFSSMFILPLIKKS